MACAWARTLHTSRHPEPQPAHMAPLSPRSCTCSGTMNRRGRRQEWLRRARMGPRTTPESTPTATPRAHIPPVPCVPQVMYVQQENVPGDDRSALHTVAEAAASERRRLEQQVPWVACVGERRGLATHNNTRHDADGNVRAAEPPCTRPRRSRCQKLQVPPNLLRPQACNGFSMEVRSLSA